MNEVEINNNILSRIEFLESEFEKIKDLLKRESDLTGWAKNKLIESRAEDNNFLIDLDDFSREKVELESTLATIELLSDKEVFKKIVEGREEIKKGELEEFSFDEIDSL